MGQVAAKSTIRSKRLTRLRQLAAPGRTTSEAKTFAIGGRLSLPVPALTGRTPVTACRLTSGRYLQRLLVRLHVLAVPQPCGQSRQSSRWVAVTFGKFGRWLVGQA